MPPAGRVGAIYTSGMRPMCFLCDFGLADDFVGTCKGVMLEHRARGIYRGPDARGAGFRGRGRGGDPGARHPLHAGRHGLSGGRGPRRRNGAPGTGAPDGERGTARRA